MGCPCTDPKTKEIKEVSAKTKEMVYRVQAPWIIEAIKNEQNINGITKMGNCGAGRGSGKR